MNLRNAAPPFTRNGPTAFSMLGTMIFALCSLLIVPTVRYGIRPLTMAGVTVLTCCLCEAAANLAAGGAFGIRDPSPAVTGLILAFLLPINAPLWLPCAAGAFAILIAKIPFGSFGRAPFNPAAAGAAFVSLCWPHLALSWFDPAKPYVLPPFADCTFQVGTSPAAVLKNGLVPDVLPLDMLWGETPGPATTGGILIICACALLLFLSRSAHWEATVGFVATSALLAALFPRIVCSPLSSAKYEILSGSLLFCAVFMIPEPGVQPRTAVGRGIYGALAGAILMGFRFFGVYEESVCFAVIAANAIAPLIDTAVGRLRGWEGRTA